MPKGELVIKGRFEWFSEKDELNVKKHGFSFEQILVGTSKIFRF